MSAPTIQIGKNKITEGTFQLLESCFKAHEAVKVVMLRGSGHTKESTKEAAEAIKARLGSKYTYRIVGFTIFLRKWRKEQK